MNAKEIIEAIEKAGIEVGEFAYGDFDSPEGVGPYVEVDRYGGEGKGETWYSVKHFTDHDVYIRTDGFYSSYQGTEFDNGYGEEVRPVTKTITVFE